MFIFWCVIFCDSWFIQTYVTFQCFHLHVIALVTEKRVCIIMLLHNKHKKWSYHLLILHKVGPQKGSYCVLGQKHLHQPLNSNIVRSWGKSFPSKANWPQWKYLGNLQRLPWCNPRIAASYLDTEQNRRVANTSTHILRVEGGVGLAHEGRLQRVATLAVLQEPAVVQVHLLAVRLKVQSN